MEEGVVIGTDRLIARRELTLKERDSPEQAVTVELYAPAPFTDGHGYYCAFKITGAGVDLSRWMAGADSMQALQLAISSLAVLLRSIFGDPNVNLYWTEPKDDLGFPESSQ